MYLCYFRHHPRCLSTPRLAFLTPKIGRDYTTCAIVGNSQTMLTASRGSEIDAHGVVVRLNNAPTLGFERFVGGRTTHRLLNGVWTQRYGRDSIESNRVANVMPLEVGVTAVATRAIPKGRRIPTVHSHRPRHVNDI